MTMNNMNLEFEKAGFEVERTYESKTAQYRFTISKDGFSSVGYFDWKEHETLTCRDRRQKKFIEDLLAEHQACLDALNPNAVPVATMCAVFEEVTPEPLKIKVVHFSGGVTTVIWEDGTKSQVRCQEGDEFDPEKGLALAIAKRVLGNKGSWYDEIKKWTEPYYRNVAQRSAESILNMFGVKLNFNKMKCGNFEFTKHSDGGATVKYVGPQDSDEAKKIDENNKSPEPTTDTTPQPVSGETPNGGIRCSTCKHIDTPVTQIPCSGCDWHYSCWEASEEVVPPVESDKPQTTHYNPVEEAYNLALKIRDGKYGDIEAIIGFLGEALDV